MTTWYVATTGSDSNDGKSAGSAFLTIPHAASVAQPGDTVSVASGDYPGSFTITCSGTSGAPITIKSETKWGARIVVPASNAAHQWGIIVGSSGADGSVGAYVTLDGFDVDGIDGGALSQVGEEDGAIEAAAGQDGDAAQASRRRGR